jgi:hypothetical protein
MCKALQDRKLKQEKLEDNKNLSKKLQDNKPKYKSLARFIGQGFFGVMGAEFSGLFSKPFHFPPNTFDPPRSW